MQGVPLAWRGKLEDDNKREGRLMGCGDQVRNESDGQMLPGGIF